MLLNPAASRDVRPTPGVPALTSRASAPLSFVFLIPPAAPTLSEAPALRLVAHIPWLKVTVCSLAGQVRVRKSAPLPRAGGYRFLAPSPFCLSSDICAWFHGSPLHTSILSDTQRWRCSFVEIQMYPPASQADCMDVQAGLVPIQLDSRDWLKNGSPTPPPS